MVYNTLVEFLKLIVFHTIGIIMSKLSKEVEEKIIKLYVEDKLSADKICEKTKITQATILRVLKRNNIERRQKTHRLLGAKFNKLTAIKDLGFLKYESTNGKNRNRYWECECECGTKIILSATRLRLGKAKSCGCLKRTWNWKGYKDISGHEFGRIRLGAINRNINFDVTIEQIQDLYEKQNKKCALSGIDIYLAKSHVRAKNGLEPYSTASLDRIDSTKGYTIDNIQWIHKNINIMKSSISQEYFLNVCTLIADHNKDKFNRIDITDWFEFCFRKNETDTRGESNTKISNRKVRKVTRAKNRVKYENNII